MKLDLPAWSKSCFPCPADLLLEVGFGQGLSLCWRIHLNRHPLLSTALFFFFSQNTFPVAGKCFILGSSRFSGTCRNFFTVRPQRVVAGREENQEGIRSVKSLFPYKKSFSSKIVKARRGMGVGKSETFCPKEGTNF